MAFETNDLDPYAPTDRIGSERHNKLIRKVNALARFTAGNLGIVRDPDSPVYVTDIFPALIRSTGPNGEADFTNAQYWFDVATPDQALAALDPITVSADSVLTETAAATNLGELQDGEIEGSTHLLKPGTIVTIFALSVLSNPPIDVFVFTHAVKRGLFLVDLTTDGGSQGTDPPGATACDLTYVAVDPDSGLSVGSGLSPEKGRDFVCHYSIANKGTGQWTQSGTNSTFSLWDTNEHPDSSVCS